MGEDQVSIERAQPADLGQILRDYQHFWGDLELPRYLHHPMFVYEFGDTAFVAHRPDGVIAGYLLGFVAPTGDGYIHFAAVRDDARGLGLGRRLYAAFTEAALARGATALKAITNPGNEASIAFHRQLGFDATLAEDYGGAGRPRVVMRRALPPARADRTPGSQPAQPAPSDPGPSGAPPRSRRPAPRLPFAPGRADRKCRSAPRPASASPGSSG